MHTWDRAVRGNHGVTAVQQRSRAAWTVSKGYDIKWCFSKG